MNRDQVKATFTGPGVNIDLQKLRRLLHDLQDHLDDAATEHRSHADDDPPSNMASRLLAEIDGHPEAPIPWTDVTMGLRRRIRQALASVSFLEAAK